MRFVLVMVGAVLGGLMVNDQLTPVQQHSKEEIVYGTRVDTMGQLQLVVTK